MTTTVRRMCDFVGSLFKARTALVTLGAGLILLVSSLGYGQQRDFDDLVEVCGVGSGREGRVGRVNRGACLC